MSRSYDKREKENISRVLKSLRLFKHPEMSCWIRVLQTSPERYFTKFGKKVTRFWLMVNHYWSTGWPKVDFPGGGGGGGGGGDNFTFLSPVTGFVRTKKINPVTGDRFFWPQNKSCVDQEKNPVTKERNPVTKKKILWPRKEFLWPRKKSCDQKKMSKVEFPKMWPLEQ